MFVTRRHILALAGSSVFLRSLKAASPGGRESDTDSYRRPAQRFDVDRLLDTGLPSQPGASFSRKYVCNATVMLFGIPLVSKGGVGSGYTVIEEAPHALGHKVTSIQFGAGSWPESARGLNRLGFIQEAITEGANSASPSGKTSESAYVAFMTTSQEKNLDQAKKALENTAGMVPYSAAQGLSANGHISSRIDHLQFPAKLTWRDIPGLLARAREAMAASTAPRTELPVDSAVPGTFLHTVRAAQMNPDKHTSGQYFFNSKLFLLETEKEPDAAKKLVKLSATITKVKTGEKNTFRLWYEVGAEHMPPLRFDYQAKSFLRLTFEADHNAATPPIHLALASAKENA